MNESGQGADAPLPALAGKAMEVAQLAQPGAPTSAAPGPVEIGRVETVSGQVFATHDSGGRSLVAQQQPVRVALQKGAAVYLGDKIETANDGSVEIVFTDKTKFSLGGDAAMVLDELIYNPGAQDNTSLFSVLQGSFVFISGEVAKAGPDAMQVRTPSGTLGIRGTAVGCGVNAGGGATACVLLPHPDGSEGHKVAFINASETYIIAHNFEAVLSGSIGAPLVVTTLTGPQVQALLGDALNGSYFSYLDSILDSLDTRAGDDDGSSLYFQRIDFESNAGLGRSFRSQGPLQLEEEQPQVDRSFRTDNEFDPAGGSLAAFAISIPTVDAIPNLPQVPGSIIALANVGFEDGLPNQNIGEADPTLIIQLVLAFLPADNEQLGDLTISGIPDGARLFVGGAGSAQEVAIVDGSVTVAADALGGLFLMPPANDDTDLALTFTGTVTDPDSNESFTLTGSLPVVVDAAADLPTLAVDIDDAVLQQPEAQLVAVPIAMTFADFDGSETHQIVITGIPEDWILQDSAGLDFEIQNGVYIATLNNQQLAQSGGRYEDFILFRPGEWTGTANIHIEAIAREVVLSGSEITESNNVASAVSELEIRLSLNTHLTTSAYLAVDERDIGETGGDSVHTGPAVIGATDTALGAGNLIDVRLVTDGLPPLTSNGVEITYCLSEDGRLLTAFAGDGEVIFTVAIDDRPLELTPGMFKFEFTLIGPLDHAPGAGENSQAIEFGYVASTTGENPTEVDGQFAVKIVDDVPATIVHDPLVVYEEWDYGQWSEQTNTASGWMDIDFGADGPAASGHLVLTSGPENLTSDGQAVSLVVTDTEITGVAGEATIFTLSLNPDTGQYEFTLHGPLDHNQGEVYSDVLDLNFGFTATDADGDEADGTITVSVYENWNVLHSSDNVLAGNLFSDDGGAVGLLPAAQIDLSGNGADTIRLSASDVFDIAGSDQPELAIFGDADDKVELIGGEGEWLPNGDGSVYAWSADQSIKVIVDDNLAVTLSA